MNIFPEFCDERELSTRERALRDVFVKEYLIDFDPIVACMRCGFTSVMAAQYAARFMEEPYVQRKIRDEQMKTEDIADIDSKEAKKQQILAGLLREAHYRGPGSSQSARVAALSKLASIHGLDSVNKPGSVDNSGVMLVPGVASLDDWEKVAQASQEKLANDSIVH